MKKTAGFLLAFFCACFGLRAQVTIDVTLDQKAFLPGEALNAIVRITNLSGQTLHLGQDEGWLKFAVASRDGSVVPTHGEAPVKEKIDLESAQAVIKRVNIAPYFDLKTPGEFSLVATATIKDWNQKIASAPVPFDIANAATLWLRDFGVPRAAGASNAPPEVRRYALLEANHLSKLTLYFQLTDASGNLNRVYQVGRMLNVDTPDAQIDKFSNLHVLYQIGPHSSCYLVINTDGELITRQTYVFAPRPRLKFDEEGKIVVAGGERRVSDSDLPPPKIADSGVKTN
jgi:hypothetical protein